MCGGVRDLREKDKLVFSPTLFGLTNLSSLCASGHEGGEGVAHLPLQAGEEVLTADQDAHLSESHNMSTHGRKQEYLM